MGMIIVEMAVIININEKDIIVLIIFLVTLLILNIIFWVVFKLLDINKPKYMYWYLFVLSWVVAFFIGWIVL